MSGITSAATLEIAKNQRLEKRQARSCETQATLRLFPSVDLKFRTVAAPTTTARRNTETGGIHSAMSPRVNGNLRQLP